MSKLDARLFFRFHLLLVGPGLYWPAFLGSSCFYQQQPSVFVLDSAAGDWHEFPAVKVHAISSTLISFARKKCCHGCGCIQPTIRPCIAATAMKYLRLSGSSTARSKCEAAAGYAATMSATHWQHICMILSAAGPLRTQRTRAASAAQAK